MMGRRLLGWLGASLVMRLLLAQMGTVVLLWLGVIAYMLWDSSHNDRDLQPPHVNARADMVLAVVDNLAAEPARLQEALARIDAFQRREDHEEDKPALRLTMNVWDGPKLLYASPGQPGAIPAGKVGEVERVQLGGTPWRTYSQLSPRSGVRVTFARSEETQAIMLAYGSKGLLLLPLLISLPFLFLPAWISVRLALKPWRRFSREIERRGPDDLAPVQSGSSHKELRPLAKAVNSLLERLRTSMARERSFIADAAHELRTPLAAMRINVEALQGHQPDARDAELLEGLVRSGERASRLVNQLLGLMRSDAAGAARSQRLPLDALLQDRLAALSGLASERDVELALSVSEEGAPEDYLLQADRESLTSLVDNLLDNAIKHSPAGTTVQVRLARDAASLVMSIEDEGAGIPAELRERVFDRFFRVPDQPQPGSGLGLAIVKAVADRMGACIELADGESGRGLRVVLRFPTAKPQPAASVPPAKP